MTECSRTFVRDLRNRETTSMFAGLSSMYRMLACAPAGRGGASSEVRRVSPRVI
jgi:hypothetical protein